MFVTAVRTALLDGRVDVVVHSFKDLPTARRARARASPRCRRGRIRPTRSAPGTASRFDSLPSGATVGTGSPRRAAQLLARRPDLQVVPIRGNVDTRLRLVADGRLDAVVLAAAGLRRLGRSGRHHRTVRPRRMLPAPAQGALAVECRAADVETAWYGGRSRPHSTMRPSARGGRRRARACWPRWRPAAARRSAPGPSA